MRSIVRVRTALFQIYKISDAFCDKACTSILLVGEGKVEYVFLHHLKSLYISRHCGISVKIRNIRGKGSDHVVDHAIRHCRNSAFDRVVVPLDSDIAMSPNVRRRAVSKKVQIIESKPCLEGLLIRILGKHVPATGRICKEKIGDILQGLVTTESFYKKNFPMTMIEVRRQEVPELERLLSCLFMDDSKSGK